MSYGKIYSACRETSTRHPASLKTWGSRHEINEKEINLLYIKSIQFGRDGFTQEDKEQIESLAKSCPLINGSAVFKARTLWHSFEPWIDYDDINICNNIGQNKKSSAGYFDFLNDTTISQNNNIILNANTIYSSNIKPNINNSISLSVIPNPTSGQISIKYQINENSTFLLFNSLGEKVKEIELPYTAQTVTTTLDGLASGVYLYKIKQQNYILNIGKLNLIK